MNSIWWMCSGRHWQKRAFDAKVVTAAFRAGDKQVFELASQHFLHLILLQDQLLGTRKEFKVGTWIEAARSAGQTQEEKALYEWNARVQITTWEIV